MDELPGGQILDQRDGLARPTATEGRLGSGWDGYTALGYLDGRRLVTGLG